MAGIDYSAKEGYALDGVSQVDGWLNGEDYNKRSYVLYNYYTNIHDVSFDDGASVAIRWASLSFSLSVSLCLSPSLSKTEVTLFECNIRHYFLCFFIFYDVYHA